MISPQEHSHQYIDRGFEEEMNQLIEVKSIGRKND